MIIMAGMGITAGTEADTDTMAGMDTGTATTKCRFQLGPANGAPALQNPK